VGNHLEFKKKRRIKPFVLSRRCKIVFRARCISTCRLQYFSIFFLNYTRALVIGLNKKLGFIFFVILAVLGRVNNWELFIIPLLLVVMFIFSAKNNNVSDEKKYLLKDIK
jgi:hypothetical protein